MRRFWLMLSAVVIAGSLAAVVLTMSASAAPLANPPGPVQYGLPVYKNYTFPTPWPTASWAPGKYVWQANPIHKAGVAIVAEYNGSVAENMERIPHYTIVDWTARPYVMENASARNVVYYPQVTTIGVLTTTDLDGIPYNTTWTVNGTVFTETKDLVDCPLSSSLIVAKQVAAQAPGALWTMFNEPDGWEDQSRCRDGSAFWAKYYQHPNGDGPGGIYTDPTTGLTYTAQIWGYRQAAEVAKAYIDLIRSVDPTARFACCGEITGGWGMGYWQWPGLGSYTVGVAQAYYDMYGEDMPLAAVHEHIYPAALGCPPSDNIYCLIDVYNDMVARLDAQGSRVAGLPIIITEHPYFGPKSEESMVAELLVHKWNDYLGTQERVIAHHWFADYYCRTSDRDVLLDGKYQCGKTPPTPTPSPTPFADWGAPSLFDDYQRTTLSDVGQEWRARYCSWNDSVWATPVPGATPCPTPTPLP